MRTGHHSARPNRLRLTGRADTFAPTRGERGIVAEVVRTHLLLTGEAAARPAGLAAALAKAGFRVDQAPPGGDIKAAVEGEAPDAVLICLSGAGAGDLASVKQLRETAQQWAELPLLAVVPAGDARTVAGAILAGADDAVSSPVDGGELRSRVDRLLARREEVRELRASLRARDLLFDIFQEVSAALRAEEIFQTLVRRVGQALSLSHCSFVLTSPGAQHGRVVAVYENPSVRDMRVELSRYPEIQEALRTERAVVIDDVREHPLFATIRDTWDAQSADDGIRSAVALPVFVQGTPAGVFFLRTREGDPELTARDVALADTIAKAASKVLENEERRAAMSRRQLNAGALDVLTGCASLDALDRRLRDEYERARRYRLRFCLVVLDVDQFRVLNDRLGAQAGDRILADLGQILQRELRSPDFVARYGGDEFALVLPETDARGARNFVQRLSSVVSKHTFPDLGGDHPAFSAGVVSYPHPEALRPEDLFALADAALAKAKASPDERIAIALSPGV
jgi:diguanylate cyclase (GGDEF)-like protein